MSEVQYDEQEAEKVILKNLSDEIQLEFSNDDEMRDAIDYVLYHNFHYEQSHDSGSSLDYVKTHCMIDGMDVSFEAITAILNAEEIYLKQIGLL
jgi:hypothetical protein